MKTFALVLLTITAITAAPATSSKEEDGKNSEKLQRVILKEIIQSVIFLNGTLNNKEKKMFVHPAVKRGNCTHQNLCKAALVLDKLKIENLGLEEKNWLLPRQLVAYTRDIQCKVPASDHKIELQDLLQNVLHCAQEMFLKK